MTAGENGTLALAHACLLVKQTPFTRDGRNLLATFSNEGLLKLWKS